MAHADLPDVGINAHHVIDALLPTPQEKADLEDLIAGVLEIQVSTADVSDPPTDGELDAEFGTPAAVGAGYVAVLDDDGGGADVYLCVSDGTNWWYVALSKAV